MSGQHAGDNKMVKYGIGAAILFLLFGRNADAKAASNPDLPPPAGDQPPDYPKSGGGAVNNDAAHRFIRVLWDAIESANPKLGTAARILITAHAAYESGWGTKARAARLGNNLFNITVLKSSGKPYLEGPDYEYDAQGNKKAITQLFAKYATYAESVKDYLGYLASAKKGTAQRYPGAVAALEKGDVETFIKILYAGGYFTQPVDKYLPMMRNMLTSVNSRLAVALTIKPNSIQKLA